MKKPRKKKQKQPATLSEEREASNTVVVREPEIHPRVPAHLARDNSVAWELAPAMPDIEEPTASSISIPVLIIALLGLAVYFSDMYLMEHSGQFNELVYYPNREVPKPPGGPNLYDQGQQVYSLVCSACHQPDGNGSSTQNVPPLAGSEWVLAEGPNRIIRIVLNGLNGPIEVKGKSFNNQMLAWKDTLTKDEQVAGVLTYVRQSWGNHAAGVTPEQVKAIREETKARSSQWTVPELLQIPE